MKQYVSEPLGRLFRQPAFVSCLLVLLIGALGLRVAAEKLQWYLRKEPIYLQKPLDQLDQARLAPYVLHRAETIPKEIVEELGTHEYIQWVLEDTSVDERDPLRYVVLFVTYYTGNPDKVPHVPDWCNVGAGGQLLSARNTTLNVPDIGADDDELPVRVLELELPSDGLRPKTRKQVAYFFAVNGDYRCQRDAVRIRQNWLTDRYTYFSKVEINFPLAGSLSEDKILQATEKFARVLVPVLVEDHWPDWEAATRVTADN